MSHKKAPPRRGLKEVVVLLSAGDFLTAINKNRTLNVGCSSDILVVLLAAIGQGHNGFIEAISGPRSMA